jgi:hypothetical protein
MAELTPPVIVLGMHRSGTSLVTGCLQEAGLFLGDVNTSAPSNRKGNRENESLRECHDRMLTTRGYDWKTPPPAPVEWTSGETDAILDRLAAYGDAPRWGFKDPRTIWLIDGYLGLFPDAKLIAPFRHPDSVARSLASRPPSLALSLTEGLALWRMTNEKLLDLSETGTVTLLRFSEGGIEDPLFSGPMSRFVQDVGLSGDWRGFYDGGLHHQRPGEVDDAGLGSEDHRIWQALNARAEAQA